MGEGAATLHQYVLEPRRTSFITRYANMCSVEVCAKGPGPCVGGEGAKNAKRGWGCGLELGIGGCSLFDVNVGPGRMNRLRYAP